MQPKTGNDLRETVRINAKYTAYRQAGAKVKLRLVGWIHMAYLELPLRYYVSFLVRLTQEVP